MIKILKQFPEIIKIFPKKIFINNLSVIVLNFLKFVFDIVGLSLFVLIIINYLNKENFEFNLVFGEVDLNFINKLTSYELILTTLVVYIIKFLTSLILIYLRLLISNKNHIILQNIILKDIFLNNYQKLTLKNISLFYRNITAEIKFTSIFFKSVIELISNIIIIIFSLFIISFLIQKKGFLILIFALGSLFLITLSIKKKLSSYGELRIRYNKLFYEFFHNVYYFSKNLILNNRVRQIIKHMSSLKQNEWKSGYLIKFFQESVPLFLEIIFIVFVLVVLYLNLEIKLISKPEILFLLFVLMRMQPYLVKSQENFNDIITYFKSYNAIKHHLKINEHSQKINYAKKSFNKLALKFKENNNNKVIELNRNEKLLILSNDVNKLNDISNCISNFHNSNIFQMLIDGSKLNSREFFQELGFLDNDNQQLIFRNYSLKNNITLFSKKIIEQKYSDIIKLIGLDQFDDLLNIDQINLDSNFYLEKKILLARTLYLGQSILVFNQYFDDNILDREMTDRVFKYLKNFTVIVLSKKTKEKNIFDISKIYEV